MKFTLSSRQPPSILQQADEILIAYKDKKQILDFIELYPSKTLILIVEPESNWKEIAGYAALTNQLMLCLRSLDDIPKAQEIGCPYYLGYYTHTFYEARGLVALGVCYLKVAEPIFFQMDALKSLNVPIRVAPNVCYTDGIKRPNGAVGRWIRPEDLNGCYRQYIDAVEFEACEHNIDKEKALFRIYSQEQTWDTLLEIIIEGLDMPVTNRILNDFDVGKRRLNCGQRCQETGKCHYCEYALKIANLSLWENYNSE